MHYVRIAPNDETFTSRCNTIPIARLWISDIGSRWLRFSVWKLISAHELADEILQKIPMVK
jgi:hypothetical protein